MSSLGFLYIFNIFPQSLFSGIYRYTQSGGDISLVLTNFHILHILQKLLSCTGQQPMVDTVKNPKKALDVYDLIRKKIFHCTYKNIAVSKQAGQNPLIIGGFVGHIS